MAAHRLFCDIKTLSEVIQLRKERPYSTVFSIVDKLSDVYLEEDKDQIKEYAFSNPIINKMLKRDNRSIFSKISIREEIKNPRADDIFLLLPQSSAQFSEYRETHGVLVTRSLSDMQFLDNLCYAHFRPFNLLTQKQKKRLRDHNEEFENISSWEEVFDVLRIEPINSAVIIDNYIFTHFDRRKNSLYSIIKKLVPQKLKIPFHLTIFVYNDGKLEKCKMEQVINEIHELTLTSPILVSIIAHTDKTETHDRHILTNFHIISSGKGFGVIDYRGVQENAKGEISSTFHNIEYLPSSNSIKHQHSHLIDWMKDIYIHGKGMNAIYAFVVGDEFQNRLLKD